MPQALLPPHDRHTFTLGCGLLDEQQVYVFYATSTFCHAKTQEIMKLSNLSSDMKWCSIFMNSMDWICQCWCLLCRYFHPLHKYFQSKYSNLIILITQLTCILALQINLSIRPNLLRSIAYYVVSSKRPFKFSEIIYISRT